MASNLFNLLKIVIEIKLNPHQKPQEVYSALGISKSGYYKYKKRLEEELGFKFEYSRKNKCLEIEKEPFLPTLNLELSELSALVRSMGQFYASGGDYSFKQRHQHAFSVYNGDTPITVRIRFNRRKAAYIKEVLWHPSQKITDDPDRPGSIIFEVQVAEPKEVIWWMSQWGCDAEVLEPQEMREYKLEIAKREVEMYSR